MGPLIEKKVSSNEGTQRLTFGKQKRDVSLDRDSQRGSSAAGRLKLLKAEVERPASALLRQFLIFGTRQYRSARRLLHSHRLSQIARLIDVSATQDGDVVRQ